MTNNQKGNSNWIRNFSYLGGLASLIFIMVQAFIAGRSIIKSNEWEKAKMTIENIERFKENLRDSPIDLDTRIIGDKIWADFSTSKGWELSDTLRVIYRSLFDDDYMKMFDDCLRMIDIMDAFAYPIIMGYASEVGSYKNVAGQFQTYGNYIMPNAFHTTPLIGLHAKLLYRLWRIRYELLVVNGCIEQIDDEFCNQLSVRFDHLLYYEGSDISESSLKEYREKLEKKLKEVQKEIKVFRKNSMK